ncbi:hypothetical protein B0F90DRAFT_1929161 [Multifurca ochricompacta]|uniref:ubiquitinyl hydrolase 1 n=1 Tax=Multifurca ochricompacta TaxID=376703 RepID=A0AAD4LUK5_9AGAM|nr:hypothetical protein B0F90DRAFT_1929161 [Multifurca ochricompacta]
MVSGSELTLFLHQLLSNRLSGLANRPIYYVPFSRSLGMGDSVVKNIWNLYRRCITEGGVLVVQPEHMLSQKLMCIDALRTTHDDHEKFAIASELKEKQDWLDKVSRDILDESDEILHIRYQLVCTSGEPKPVEDHPNRWITTQQVFSRLQEHATQLHAKFPKEFELSKVERGFPTMRILNYEVSREISLLVANDACEGLFSNLPLTVLTGETRSAARRFMVERKVSDEDRQLVHSQCSGTSLWSGILLLRGLLVNGEGILSYVLKERRWRVDYGLDPHRTLLAVPYRAKDVPSLRAEFGHPDVAIALTCLSYYYRGLTKDQVLQCFDLLAKLDNPEMEYEHWVALKIDDIPGSSRQLNGVNTEDGAQVDDSLMPLFKKNTRVVDFYLSQVVFPRAAKEFPFKLSTSAWDLVEDKTNLTTGFSGSVRKEKMANATVFFNDDDGLTVLTQDGIIQPFISSPFNKQLDKCVVYLDNAHTRGTDLKLPQGTRAAVTLGPKVTKDRLLQGCMRMRQLGKGHSVMFFAPGEVDQRIRSYNPSVENHEKPIQARDILRWAMHETCEDIRRHLPHWAEQGLHRHKRLEAYRQYSSTGDLAVLKRGWLQPESRSLEEMYDPLAARSVHDSDATAGSGISSIPAIHERMERLGAVKSVDVRMAEEQEREVHREFEQERQVERPPKVHPALHAIHEDIRTFVETGKIPGSSKHILPLFSPTGLNKELDSMEEWPPSPLTTTDFAITTADSNGLALTDYLRPVNWILSSRSGKMNTVVVISPYEANGLLPIVRKSQYVSLHLYSPRVTATMRSFSNLTFYSVPESPAQVWSAPLHTRIELNLFAGQLYFDSREEYERVCTLLALSLAHPDARCVEVDGFVPPEHRTKGSSPFATSKIPVLKDLIALRRKGMGYDKTQLGQILNVRPLSEKELPRVSS